uniref:Putative plant UBX domain-containing protein 4 n=1 Tax=Davidia involucrata TaxID=16924 RepID=A0A5B7BGS7_DAVIN
MQSVTKSECPKELEPADRRRTEVHVNLMRKEENYPVPEKRRISFQGVGRTLGSTSSTTLAEPAVTVTSLTSSGWQMVRAWFHASTTTIQSEISVPSLMHQGLVGQGIINCRQLGFLPNNSLIWNRR